MSYYITCINNNDTIQAYIETNLNNKYKYEVAIVELFLKISWKVNWGIISLFDNEKKIKTSIDLNGNDGLSLNKLSNDFNYKIKDYFNKAETENLPMPLFHYSSLTNNLTLNGKDHFKFKFDEDSKKTFKINNSYISNAVIPIEPLIIKNQIININTDVIYPQIHGDKRQSILRTIIIDIDNDTDIIHQIYTNPHYISVSKTALKYINIWVIRHS
jgi:hypothetical protein